jgi:hypothetical protein
MLLDFQYSKLVPSKIILSKLLLLTKDSLDENQAH